MATPQQQINYGNTANDGQGDPLRTAFIKTDDNFDAIWAAGPVGSNVSIVNNTIQVSDTNGSLTLSPNGIGNVRVTRPVVPNSNNTHDLGSANLRYRAAWVGSGGLDVSGDVSAGNVSAGVSLGLPVYANSATRDAAISSPQPGMMVFITGTGLQVRGATAWNTVPNTAT